MTNKLPYTRLLIAKDRTWLIIPTFIIGDRIYGVGYNATHKGGYRSDWALENFEDINWDRLKCI